MTLMLIEASTSISTSNQINECRMEHRQRCLSKLPDTVLEGTDTEPSTSRSTSTSTSRVPRRALLIAPLVWATWCCPQRHRRHRPTTSTSDQINGFWQWHCQRRLSELPDVGIIPNRSATRMYCTHRVTFPLCSAPWLMPVLFRRGVAYHGPWRKPYLLSHEFARIRVWKSITNNLKWKSIAHSGQLDRELGTIPVSEWRRKSPQNEKCLKRWLLTT